MSRITNRVVLSLMGISAVALFIIGWFIQDASGPLTILKMAAFSVSALMYVLCSVNIKDENIGRQLIVVNMLLLIFQALLCVVTLRMVIAIRYYSEICYLVIWTFVPIFLLVRGIIKDRKQYLGIVRFVADNKYLIIATLIVVAVAIICSYDTDGPHFVWDSNLAYNQVFREIDIFSLFKPKDMKMSYHLSVSYFYPISLFSFLFNSIEAGFFAYNACCLTFSAFGFAFLFKSIFPSEKTSTHVFLLVLCMISPYISGISTLYFFDYAAICITPLIVLTAYRRKWVWFVCCGIFAVFIKEPEVIYYAAVCLAVLICDIIVEKKRIKDIITDIRYWFMTLPGFVFLACFLGFGFFGSEPHNESIGFDVEHILRLLKVFCVLNYTWVLTALAVAFAVYMVLVTHKNADKHRAFIILSISSLCFLCFNLAVISPSTNPRYTDSFYPSILIMALMFMTMVLKDNRFRITVFALLGGLFVLSDLTSADPISKLLFNSVDIGETSLYSTGIRLCDSTIYNRQYYGFDIAISEVMAKAVNEPDTAIVISTGKSDSNWTMSGKWTFDVDSGIYEFDELWDKEKNIRAPGFGASYDEDRYDPIKVKYIFASQDTVRELNIGKPFIYIYMPSQNEGREYDVRESYRITEEGTVTRRGCKIAYLKGM